MSVFDPRVRVEACRLELKGSPSPQKTYPSTVCRVNELLKVGEEERAWPPDEERERLRVANDWSHKQYWENNYDIDGKPFPVRMPRNEAKTIIHGKYPMYEALWRRLSDSGGEAPAEVPADKAASNKAARVRMLKQLRELHSLVKRSHHDEESYDKWVEALKNMTVEAKVAAI